MLMYLPQNIDGSYPYSRAETEKKKYIAELHVHFQVV